MDSATRILDIAERRMRLSGYNAVSYRDIAKEMGIKSASLHYHFPKKQDLGIALVRRYSSNFQAALMAVTTEVSDPRERLSAFTQLCRNALEAQRLVCLCAVLGAEAPGLPDGVTAEVRAFFEGNIAWLSTEYKTLGVSDPAGYAKATLAAIEGAMIVTIVNDDIGVFDAAVDLIEVGFK